MAAPAPEDAKRELARLLFGERDELAGGVGLNAGSNHEDVR
jgi:hypothetical protein